MASYAKVLIVLVALILAVVAALSSFVVQGVCMLLLTLTVIWSPNGDAYLLVPLALLGERCLQARMALGHSPVPFYSAALAAYFISSLPAAAAAAATAAASLASVKGPTATVSSSSSSSLRRQLTHEERTSHKTQPTNKSKKPMTMEAKRTEGIVLSVLIGLLFGIVTGSAVHGSALAVSAVTALVMYPPLAGVLGSREAILLALWAAMLVGDAISNTLLVPPINERDPHGDGPHDGKVRPASVYITSFPHLAGRSALLAVLTIGCLMHTAQQRSKRLAERPRLTFLVLTCLCVGTAVLYVTWKFDEDPFLWLWAYLHTRRHRLYTLLIWFTGIPILVALTALGTTHLHAGIRRKCFHILAVVMFAPIAVIDPSFYSFAVTGALCGGILVELLRFHDLLRAKWGSAVFGPFLDARDEVVIRSHLYLLFGLAMSVWLRCRVDFVMARPMPWTMQVALDVLPGLGALGVVDTFAAVGGLWSRRHAPSTAAVKKPSSSSALVSAPPVKLSETRLHNRWFSLEANPSLRHKTVRGVATGFVFGLAFWILLFVVLAGMRGQSAWRDYSFWALNIEYVIAGGVVVGSSAIWEAVTDGVDNLELPLAVYAVACAAFSLTYS